VGIVAIGDSLDSRGSNACVSGAFNFAIVELKAFPSKLMVLVIFLYEKYGQTLLLLIKPALSLQKSSSGID
jgi:hypothetical protein